VVLFGACDLSVFGVLVLRQGRALDVGRVCILGALAATAAAALPKYDTVVVTIKEKVQNVAAAALSALLPWAACVAHFCVLVARDGGTRAGQGLAGL
jgi:hypothetical protein